MMKIFLSSLLALVGVLALSPISISAGNVTPYSAPAFTGITDWVNTKPLTMASLSGKVVLIDFWTYSCVNCIRTLPYLTAWDSAYRSKGLVIVGVHAPEFAFEKEKSNVIDAAKKAGITYPIALDNNFKTWRAYKNRYWPAKYLIDSKGNVRYTHFGEGKYDETEKKIRELLVEAGADLGGAKAAPKSVPTNKFRADQTHETYLGYARLDAFQQKSQKKNDKYVVYSGATALAKGQWSLSGAWTIREEAAVASATGASLTLDFSAKTVNLVMDSIDRTKGGTCKVLLDGKALQP